jgi:hypothetical protein
VALDFAVKRALNPLEVVVCSSVVQARLYERTQEGVWGQLLTLDMIVKCQELTP